HRHTIYPPFLVHHPAPPPALPSFPTRRSSDLVDTRLDGGVEVDLLAARQPVHAAQSLVGESLELAAHAGNEASVGTQGFLEEARDRKSTRLNSSHLVISYAVFCLKKKKKSTVI